MKTNKFLQIFLMLSVLFAPATAGATRLLELKVVDKDYLMVHFRDGEVHYRDDGTGPSAYMGHAFAEGDDTLITFAPRLDVILASNPSLWTVSSKDDKSFKSAAPVAAWRKSKPMNIDHSFATELDHWIFLQLPKSMKQGCTYTVTVPQAAGSDNAEASVKFDIWSSQSEAVHVNILGYSPSETVMPADLYLWLGDGGPRDYKSFEGKNVWLYNVNTGKSSKVGKVKFWKEHSAFEKEAGRKDLTGSDVWTADFRTTKPGKYRLVIDGVGCSMDFDVNNEIYHDPYKFSVRGYYYMRIGEPVDTPKVVPVPRQPTFTPESDPVGFTVYLTDLQPWHKDWRKIGGDVWDEPHHVATAKASKFWEYRLPGNPTNTEIKGGHSDAFDWDRHLAHVSNIYDLLLPYILTNGRIDEDDLQIRESGNGIPDIIDEARNEVDFFLSIRGLDGGYSQGVTNPTLDHMVMFQAGCTTMAAWANAANCAMLAAAFQINGNKELCEYYTKEAVTAFEYASRQENSQLDDSQGIGTSSMVGRDFRQLAAAYLYNVTADTKWEDIMAEESKIKDGHSPVISRGFRNGYCQIWATAAYLVCPHERHYADLYENMKASVNAQADELNVSVINERPSRRSHSDTRWHTAEDLQLVMIAHAVADSPARRAQLEKAMYFDASWCLGRNPANIIEMTGLGQRHITDCYSTGRNDGVPGTHPGQTPFNGVETWSKGNGGDAQIILQHLYPSWNEGWPRQESFFNQRYFWVNAEFTPRETMRGKMALLGYLYGIRK